MPKSDDPIEQLRTQRQGESENVVMGLTKKGLEKIPFVGIAIAYIQGKVREEKERFFDNAVLDIIKAQEISIDEVSTKLEAENFIRIVTAAVERIFWGASDNKIKRFAAVIANELRSDSEPQKSEDAVFFIRALDELSEDDIRVLKHLYNHQKDIVQENHAMPYNSFFHDNKMRNMLLSATDLGIQMDEFYARCSRLSGYGLALPLEKSHGSMGNPDQFAFRMTLLGKRLIDILINIGGEPTDVMKPKV